MSKHPPLPHDLLDPQDADAQGARRSASVITVRDGAAGIEVLLLRRGVRQGDMRSGVWVFPGGVLDAADAELPALATGLDEAALNARMGVTRGGALYLLGGLRECYEEVGLLWADGAADAAIAERARGPADTDFVALCRRHGLALRAGALTYHGHWLTPLGMPQRFDTRFFVAVAPPRQAAEADDGEAQELAWLTPAEALSSARNLKMLPVTRALLQDAGRHATAQAFWDATAARTPPARVMPRLARNAQGPWPVLPDHPAFAEVARLDPQGQGTAYVDLVAGRVVTLSPLLKRITCGNGGLMSGPGTNSYVLSSPGATEAAVLDPGPLSEEGHDAPAHVQALIAAAAPARITRIVLTHTHQDHSPATALLKAATGAQVIGRMAAHPEWQDATFAPDHQPTDGERVMAAPGCTLRAVATPGHASNHLCWLLEEEGLLFTGDHIMQGSTVVINPPDGDMRAYLASLERLLEEPLAWLAPGHGFLMADAHGEVRRLLAHRRGREAKAWRALDAQGPATTAALVATVYGDVPTDRHALAVRSLNAIYEQLAADGHVRADGAIWQAVSAPPSVTAAP